MYAVPTTLARIPNLLASPFAAGLQTVPPTCHMRLYDHSKLVLSPRMVRCIMNRACRSSIFWPQRMRLRSCERQR